MPEAPQRGAEGVSEGRRCPACGDPLYGWAVLEPGGETDVEGRLLERCENCGLGIAHDAIDPGLDPDERGVVTAPNRASWQSGIGGGHWAPLALERRAAYPTPRALGLLFDASGIELLRLHQPVLGANQLWMWQTLLNGFTFHDGFALRVLRGGLRRRSARSTATYLADAVVTVLAALPLALIALPLELAAVALRRGGLVEAEVRRLRGAGSEEPESVI